MISPMALSSSSVNGSVSRRPRNRPCTSLIHDARQPAAECGLFSEISERSERSHIGILNDLLGFPIGPNYAARRAKKTPVVASHDFANRRSVRRLWSEQVNASLLDLLVAASFLRSGHMRSPLGFPE
jgi:hypothetical protein